MKKATFKLFSLMLAIVLLLLCSACRSSEPTSGNVPSNTETESKEPVKLVYTAEAFSNTTLSNQEQMWHHIIMNDSRKLIKLEKTDPQYREKLSMILGTGVIEGDGSCEFKYSITTVYNWLGVKTDLFYGKEGNLYLASGTDVVVGVRLEPEFFKKPSEIKIDEVKAEEFAKQYLLDFGLTEFSGEMPQGYVLTVGPCTDGFDYDTWDISIVAKSGDREILEVVEIYLDAYGRLTKYNRCESYGIVDAKSFPNYSEAEVLAVAQQKFDEVCTANNFDAENSELEFSIHDYCLVNGELVPCVYYTASVGFPAAGENEELSVNIRVLIQSE